MGRPTILRPAVGVETTRPSGEVYLERQLRHRKHRDRKGTIF